MRSTEFITEAPARTDDFGQPINQPPTDAEYAARQAQGNKTGAAIKDFFSGTPKELKDAPPGTPIDPYVRARLGYKPFTGATQPGVLVDRDGNPVRDGSGQPIQTPNSPVAKPADVPLPQSQRNLVDPRSLDQAVPAPVQNAQPEITIPQNQRTLTDPRTLDQPAPVAPAPVAPAPIAPAPIAPAPVAPVKNVTPTKTATGIRPAILGYASAMGLYKNGRPDINAIKAFQRKNGLNDDGIIGADTSGAILSAAPAGMTGSSRGGQGGAAAYKVDSQLPIKPVQNLTPAPAPAPAAGPPPGSGTIMPGVKDSEGRQVYKRPDSSEMSWNPTTQRFFPYSGQSPIDRVRTSVGIPARGTSPGIKESQEIQRMKFLAGLNK